MIDQQSAQNYTFKIRVFLFVWVLLTGASWYFLDNFLDESLTKEFHIFLQATFATFSPIQWFGNKAEVLVNGHAYKAQALAEYLGNIERVKKTINWFFVYVPLLTGAATTLIFFLMKKKKSEAVEVNRQLKKWSGKND